MDTNLPIGTKVRTLYQHSETATIIKPPRVSLPLPSPDWFIVKSDIDGARLCIHRDMLAVRN